MNYIAQHPAPACFRKSALLIVLFFISAFAAAQHKTENVILVTLDGFRWQELYGGADSKWITPKFVKNTDALKKQFDALTVQERREKLMPFMWQTLSKQGVLIGNRWKESKMEVSNPYKISYPGYSEIFCGYVDKQIKNNDFSDNPNTNIFDFLLSQKEFENKCAAFTTWDAFTRILNSGRNKLPVFVKIKSESGVITSNGLTFENLQTQRPPIDTFITDDTLTYSFAKEYLARYHPRFAFIGFDETDAFAHNGRYDAYLNAAHTEDKFIEDLWNFIQTDPRYKNKTTLIITTDHGRGNKRPNMWRHHGQIIKNAHQTWMVAIGPDIPAKGELAGGKKYYQNQIAQTIAYLLRTNYTNTHPVGNPMDVLIKGQF